MGEVKTIEDVLDAISKLSLKFDNMKVDSTNHSVKQQDLLSAMDESKGDSLINLRSASNIFEVTTKTEF